MPVVGIKHRMRIQPGTIFIVPGGYHCLLGTGGSFELDSSDKVLFCRPSADVSLESFSFVLKSKLLAVIVSGSNEDGARGVEYVLKRGGKVVIQDPERAKFKQMPESALRAASGRQVVVYEDSILEAIKPMVYG